MTTALDTNVLVALWNKDESLNLLAQFALDAALDHGGLVIAAPVFAELLAFPEREEPFLNDFFRETGIAIDWKLDEAVWRTAGRAYQGYTVRRKKDRGLEPRRILADFLIGAHAVRNEYRLLTLDAGLYRAAFPRLSIVSL
jgi:hypothetical protein